MLTETRELDRNLELKQLFKTEHYDGYVAVKACNTTFLITHPLPPEQHNPVDKWFTGSLFLIEELMLWDYSDIELISFDIEKPTIIDVYVTNQMQYTIDLSKVNKKNPLRKDYTRYFIGEIKTILFNRFNLKLKQNKDFLIKSQSE